MVVGVFGQAVGESGQRDLEFRRDPGLRSPDERSGWVNSRFRPRPPVGDPSERRDFARRGVCQRLRSTQRPPFPMSAEPLLSDAVRELADLFTAADHAPAQLDRIELFLPLAYGATELFEGGGWLRKLGFAFAMLLGAQGDKLEILVFADVRSEAAHGAGDWLDPRFAGCHNSGSFGSQLRQPSRDTRMT